MTPSQLRAKVVCERIHWIREMVQRIRELPLDGHEEFNIENLTGAMARWIKDNPDKIDQTL